MKIDLHTHCTIGSGCSHQSVERIVADAAANGMDAVCITDHNNMACLLEAQRVSAEAGRPVFVGMEVTCDEGDFLTFGCDRPEGFPPISYEELREEIDTDRCAVIPAHAYRGGNPHGNTPEIIRTCTSDFVALEVYSTNVTDHDTEQLINLATEVGLPMVGCGDSHWPGTAGLNYTEFDDDIESLEELIAALKSGKFMAVRGDFAWKTQHR